MVLSLKSVMDSENMENNQEQNEASISVLVRNPIIHYSWTSHYTSYAINIETNHIAFTLKHSVSRRRYSEFVHLRKLLKEQHPTLTPPPLPPKTFFNNASTVFLEKRRLGLQDFLEKVMEVPMFVSNRGLHLFVQSSYPMHKIANMVGFPQDHNDEMEPHLSLSHLFPEEDPMMRLYNADVPDFDILGSLHNHNYHHGYSSPRRNSFSHAICTSCGLPRSQLQLTHGSQITLCQPALTYPGADICNGHSPPNEVVDLDSNSSLTIASINNDTPSSSATTNSLEVKPCRKKKVSFSNEVTVAQILSHNK